MRREAIAAIILLLYFLYEWRDGYWIDPYECNLNCGVLKLQSVRLNTSSALDDSGSFMFGDKSVPNAHAFYVTDLSIAIVNISPLVKYHCLVLPLRVVPRFKDLTTEEVSDLLISAQVCILAFSSFSFFFFVILCQTVKYALCRRTSRKR